MDSPKVCFLEFLFEEFLKAMNDIGAYGHQRYAEASFHHRRVSGDRTRDARTKATVIAGHALDHFDMYLRGELHDHFHTKKHQLAAVAFNAMMEYYFAGLEQEPLHLGPKPGYYTIQELGSDNEPTVALVEDGVNGVWVRRYIDSYKREDLFGSAARFKVLAGPWQLPGVSNDE